MNTLNYINKEIKILHLLVVISQQIDDDYYYEQGLDMIVLDKNKFFLFVCSLVFLVILAIEANMAELMAFQVPLS